MAQPTTTFDSKLFFYPIFSRKSSSLATIRPFQFGLISPHKLKLLSFSSSIFSFSHPNSYLNSLTYSQYYFFQPEDITEINMVNEEKIDTVANITENLKKIEIPCQSNTPTTAASFKPPQPIDTHPSYANNNGYLQQNQNQNQMYLINLNPGINQIELLQMYRQRCGDIRSSHFIISPATNQIIGLLDFASLQGLKSSFQIQEFSGYPLISVDARTFSDFPTLTSPPPAPTPNSLQSNLQVIQEKEQIPMNKMLAMKNLPFDITNEKLTYEMEQRGIYIRPSKVIYHQQNNKFSGILFVDFDTQEDATYVCEHLQQWYVGGRNITVEYKLKSMATPRTPNVSYYNNNGYINRNYTPRHPNVNQTPRNALYAVKTPGSLNSRPLSTGYYTPRQTQSQSLLLTPAQPLSASAVDDSAVMDNLLTPLESQNLRIMNEIGKPPLIKTTVTDKNVQSYAKGPDGSKGFVDQRSTMSIPVNSSSSSS